MPKDKKEELVIRNFSHDCPPKVRINGIWYTWSGGYGCTLKSHEYGVSAGDVRVIGDVMFTVYKTYRSEFMLPFLRREIWWTPVPMGARLDVEYLTKLHNAFFNCSTPQSLI